LVYQNQYIYRNFYIEAVKLRQRNMSEPDFLDKILEDIKKLRQEREKEEMENGSKPKV
jgi:hypothetical protein